MCRQMDGSILSQIWNKDVHPSQAIRFGYKIWTLCGSHRFLYQLNIYAVKSTDEPRSSGLIGQTVVKKLLQVVGKSLSPEIMKSRSLITGKK